MQIKKANKEDIDKLSNLRILQQKDDWKDLFYDDDLFNKTKTYLLKHLNVNKIKEEEKKLEGALKNYEK